MRPGGKKDGEIATWKIIVQFIIFIDFWTEYSHFSLDLDPNINNIKTKAGIGIPLTDALFLFLKFNMYPTDLCWINNCFGNEMCLFYL